MSVSAPSLLLPYLLVVGVLTVTPGPDMVLVLRNGARGGTVAAWRTGLGCCTGIAAHASAAVLGLSALLAASAAAFTVVKLAGAAYLVWLGLSALWHSRPRRPAAADHTVADHTVADHAVADHAATDQPDGERSVERAIEHAGERPGSKHPQLRADYYRQGLLTNLLNPKIALLFLTLLPQFVAENEPRVAITAVLAAVFLLVAVLWWRLFSLAVGSLGGLLSRAGVRTALDRLTGVLLIGLGLRVALERS